MLDIYQIQLIIHLRTIKNGRSSKKSRCALFFIVSPACGTIKVNHLLEEAGWRFFDDENGPANIQLEPNVKMSKADLTGLGENFDRVKNGFVDFLLLDDKGKPFIVLEAKDGVPS